MRSPTDGTNAPDLRILDDLPNVVWIQDADGRLCYVNVHAREYAGELECGTDWLGSAHPDDRPRCAEAWEHARGIGHSFEVEYRIRRRDGSYRWHAVHAQRGRGPAGAPDFWCVSATDIEEARQTRDQLEYTNAASRLLAASLDAPATINELLDLVAPRFADCALVDTFDEDGVFLERFVHGDERIVALMNRELEYRLRHPGRRTGAWSVLDSGRPRLQSSIDSAQLRGLALDEEHHALLRTLAPVSILSLPLRVGGQTIGVATLLSTTPARRYTERDIAFFQDLAARTSVAIGNAQAYVREHRIATRLQRAMLPESIPQIEGLRIDAAYLPGDEELLVGGDWYDAFVLPGDRLAISIGDVAGHGLEAAITMSQVRYALRVAALEWSSPGDVLTAANRALALDGELKIATAIFAVLDRRTLRLSYGNAGHPPAIVLGPTERLTELSFGDLPLGIDPESAYATYTLDLSPGSLVTLFTDGLIESDRDVRRGSERLFEAIRAERDFPPVRLARRIVGRVLTSANADDIAIFTVLVEGVPASLVAEPGGVRWAFRADDASAAHDARTALLTYLRARGDEDSDFAAAEIIFGELVGNVVKHAPGPITIELLWDAEAPTLRILDKGPGFELAPSLPSDPMSEGGRGLFLASAFAHDLFVVRDPEGGSRVSATLPIRRGSQRASYVS